MNMNCKTYQVGDAKITYVGELVINNVMPSTLFSDWNPDLLADHQSWLSDNSIDPCSKHLFMSIHTWVVKTKHHTILIDTGVGNNKHRPFTPHFENLQLPYLQRLLSAGVEPQAVDYVLATHLHVDHVGWNTQKLDDQWVPTFPNARYVFSKAEYDYYQNPANHNDRNKTSVIVQKDSIEPIIAAGLADMIKIDGSELLDGLSFKPTPGHSIDHTSIALTSEGEEALFVGDLMHHPIQVRYPELNSIYDAFAEQARMSRRWALEYASERKAILFCSHFPESSAGTVTNHNHKFHWTYR